MWRYERASFSSSFATRPNETFESGDKLEIRDIRSLAHVELIRVRVDFRVLFVFIAFCLNKLVDYSDEIVIV